jgi:hypothetical protein
MNRGLMLKNNADACVFHFDDFFSLITETFISEKFNDEPLR